MVAAAVAVAGVAAAATSYASAGDAADAQMDAANMGIMEQRRQFNAVQKLMKPYVDVGERGLTETTNLLGLNGNEQQQAAIESIKSGSMFNELNKQGQNAILQNASATGGLRGGNVEAALAQFSPQLLQALIDQRYQQLGNLVSVGENAASFQGNAGMQMGNNISNLWQQYGAAKAGGIIGQGKAISQGINSLSSAYGTYAGGRGLESDINQLTSNRGLY